MRFRINAIVYFLPIVILMTSCASRKEIVKFQDDTAYLRQQVYALRQENKELQRMLLELNKKINALLTNNQQVKADLLAEINSLRDKANIIDSKLADNTERMSGLMHRVETQVTPPPSTSAYPESLDSFVMDSTQQQVIDAPLESRSVLDPKEMYNAAYMDLARGNYQLALSGFQEYLARFPQSEFADNAQYWLGEVYYAQSDFNRAIEEFSRVIQNYPAGDKQAAAMLKTGYAYLNLRNRSEGVRYLRMVAQQYPASEEAKLARTKLAALNN